MDNGNLWCSARCRGDVMARRSNKPTESMTHSQLVKENKPTPMYYKGSEGKRLPRVCNLCKVVVHGTISTLEDYVQAHNLQYDYTNQAWIIDGVYAKCYCPAPGTLVNPGVPGGPGGEPYIMGECGCCLLYTSPSPRDATLSRMPSSA